jgi:AraC-like DNA-binding protein
MHRYLLSRCEDDLRLSASGIPAEIAVRQALLAQPGYMPGLKELAAEQHLSPRTLIRRLKQGNTSFRKIRDGVRRTLAADYLANSDMTVNRIAYRLGYQDPSNFGRAFRGWFGMAPGQFRTQNRRNS